MRKNLLLILMLMVLGLPFASQAQMSVTVADGTASNNYVPIYGLYCDDFIHTQIVYPASELAVLPAGGTISQLTFYVGSTIPSEAWTSTFDFKLGECTASSLTAWDNETALTTVFTGSVDASSGTMTVALSTPYTYNGGNLLLDIASVTDGNYKSVSWLGINLTGASISGYNSTSAAGASANARNFLPKTTFLSTVPAGYCAPVSNVAAADVTSSGATITWTAGGSEASWEVVYGVAGFTPDWTAAIASATTTYNVAGLNPNTSYDFYVRAVCGAGAFSGGVKVTFRTDCAAIDLTTLGIIGFETSEGFVSGTNPSSPNCWTFGNVQSANTSNIPYIYSSSSSAYAGTNSLRLYAYKSSSTDADSAYAAMPEFLTTNVSQYMLRFYAKQGSTSSTYAKNLVVGVMTDPMDMSTFVQVGSANVVGTTYAQYEVSLANYSGNGNYIAFLAAVDPESTASYRNAQYYVDNLEVMVIPSCVRPTDVAVANINTTSAQISWVAGGTETAWNIQYRVAGGENEWVTINNVTANPYTLTALTAATDYEVQVQAACSATEQSEYSNSATFTTLCDAVTTFPYVENFDGLTTNGEIPNCWNNDEGTTTNDTYKWSYNSSYGTGVTGTCVRFDSYVNPDGNTNFLKSPVLALPAGQIMMLSFQWKNPAGGDFSVYISTDGGQTHETALATGLTAASEWTLQEISLGSYAGQNVVIVFKGTSNYGSGNARIYLDDVTVSLAPACAKPVDVTVSNVSNNSAVISWVAGADETAWNLKYMVSTDTVWTTVNNVTSPYTLTGLTAATSYMVSVQSACSATDASEWTTPVNFTTTMCALEDQCQVMVIMEDSYGDGWNGNSKLYLVEATSNVVAGEAKLSTGSTDTAYISVCDGMTYNIMWQTGTYDTEISFTIYGVAADVIFSSPASLSAGQLGSFTALCTIPNCLPVQNVAVNNITKNTAVVTWSLLDATESNFVVAYGTGIDPTTMATVNSTTNSATLTGLTAGTYYNVFVKAVCSATDESDWSPMATFITTCDAFDFTTGDTLFQSFANGLECWTAYSANTENLNNFGLNINSVDGDSASFMMSSYNQAVDYNQYLISQELHSTTSMTIGFYAAVASQYSTGESFRVVYSTTDNEISSFTGVALDTTLTTVMTWCPFTAAIPANAKYVAINYYSEYLYHLLVDYIFIIAEAPVIETYNITIADNISNGTVVASAETAEAGETITLTATPAQGYHLDSYLVTATADNTQVVTVTGDSFVMPAFDVTVNAFFAPDPAETYTITIDADIENGTIEASATEAEEGETITLTATPAAEYELVAFNVYKTGDATATVTVTNNTFVMPAFDVTVSATFSYDAVGENAAESAAIYPNPSNGNVKVAANGMVNVTIFNAMGQVISNVDIEADEYEFNFENAGVYMMQIATTTGTATKRVVIVK